jgi:hypothetical protein
MLSTLIQWNNLTGRSQTGYRTISFCLDAFMS